MYYSQNNIIVEIKNIPVTEYAILNPLSGSFDLMDENEHKLLLAIKEGGNVDNISEDFLKYLVERGYFFYDKKDEDLLVLQKYEEFRAEIENSQVQLLLIPTYGCNLACTYCYQHGIETKARLITKEVVDAFFEYARKEFGGRKMKPFITLFGGEPLINSPAQREIISYIVEKCTAGDYEISIVTNGFDLVDYIDIIKQARIKEIQVTLDGSRDTHNKRRGTVNGKGTFDRIVSGVEAAAASRIPINLRTVVDNDNILDLVKLAESVDGKGWLDLGRELFKTQLGRNYELFDCYAKPEHLMSQVGLWAEFVSLGRKHPILEKFHRPDFKGIRHLVETGEMYMASFDTCPAAKTEWVFDLHGDIYGCTASCGRKEYKLGTFYPEMRLDSGAIAGWQARNVLNMDKCRECQYNVICGGGCGVVAANKNGGNVLSPDCRPVQELVELGVNFYMEEIKAMTVTEEHTSGSVLCGGELESGSGTKEQTKERKCCCS